MPRPRSPRDAPSSPRASSSSKETETFAAGTGRYDGRLGASALRETMDATSLERLARCPLQFFFHDVLADRGALRPATPFYGRSAHGRRARSCGARRGLRTAPRRARLRPLDDLERLCTRTIVREAWAEILATSDARATSVPTARPDRKRNLAAHSRRVSRGGSPSPGGVRVRPDELRTAPRAGDRGRAARPDRPRALRPYRRPKARPGRRRLQDGRGSRCARASDRDGLGARAPGADLRADARRAGRAARRRSAPRRGERPVRRFQVERDARRRSGDPSCRRRARRPGTFPIRPGSHCGSLRLPFRVPAHPPSDGVSGGARPRTRAMPAIAGRRPGRHRPWPRCVGDVAMSRPLACRRSRRAGCARPPTLRRISSSPPARAREKRRFWSSAFSTAIGSGRVTLPSIAAITFTEKAAGELRHRLADGLHEVRELADGGAGSDR